MSNDYIEVRPHVLEASIKHRLSGTAQSLYMIIRHNSSDPDGVVCEVDVKELANYFNKSRSAIYKALKDLENAGLLVKREKGIYVEVNHE